MRRSVQKQILELLASVWSGLGEINKRTPAEAEQLLGYAYLSVQTAGESLRLGLSQHAFARYVEAIARLKQSLERIYAGGKAKAEDMRGARLSLQKLQKQLQRETEIRYEIAFLPYKASMWDSLESVWKAADADPRCEAYVVPIPYYDRKADHSFGAFHYEGEEFPSYVPVVRYESYELEKRRPDIIYIHNPYDGYNSVTSVDPRYYSHELKKYTDTLVYIPYYATTGGMSEGQRSCAAYAHVDYIVIQAEKYRKFFDAAIPEEKFLPLGSPKFDRVVQMCKNPPEPPSAWKKRIAGKKVYFYNTSIGGFLGGTEAFLRKMRYVFDCFKGRDDAVLLWRPHPLLASTIDSMRPQYKEAFLEIKRRFFAEDIGIYDDTPDITTTVAICDAYIGDSGTSVTSLFGVAGKPLFLLNNHIDSAPEEDDWRGEIIRGVYIDDDKGWLVTDSNRLHQVDMKTMHYVCLYKISDYSAGYYANAVQVGKKIYVGPSNAQDICVIEGETIKKIPLRRLSEKSASFTYMLRYGKYLVLIPRQYPALVRYDTSNGEIRYFTENVNAFTGNVEGEKVIGGSCMRKGVLFLASPVNNLVLIFDIASGKEQILTTGSKSSCGCLTLMDDGTDLWFMPMNGTVITRWNPFTGEVKEYSMYPIGFKCVNPVHQFECASRPFSYAYSYGGAILFAPRWANMFIKIEKESGVITRWEPPFQMIEKPKNGYFFSDAKYTFVVPPYHKNPESSMCLLYSCYERLFYRIDLESKESRKIIPTFDVEALKKHEPGCHRCSEWLQYACKENAFNVLQNFLDGKIMGNAFDRKAQLEAFGEIVANLDGTCGEKAHRSIVARA